MKDNEPRRKWGSRMLTEAQIKHRLEYAKKYREEKKKKTLTEDEIIAKKEKQKVYSATYYKKNKKEITARNKEWKERNPDQHRHGQNKYQKRRRKSDPAYRIKMNLSRRMNEAVMDQGAMKLGTSLSLFGCSADELKAHLESQFTKGMSWDNYGVYGWHIDHIKPCSSFDLTLDSEQKICFHYSNVQPLWAKDNILKSDNY